jgi:hypothetical protein
MKKLVELIQLTKNIYIIPIQILIEKTDADVGAKCVNGLKAENLIGVVGSPIPNFPFKKTTTTVTQPHGK